MRDALKILSLQKYQKYLKLMLTELSITIGINVPAVGYSVERVAIIAKENNYVIMSQKREKNLRFWFAQ